MIIRQVGAKFLHADKQKDTMSRWTDKTKLLIALGNFENALKNRVKNLLVFLHKCGLLFPIFHQYFTTPEVFRIQKRIGNISLHQEAQKGS